MKYSITHSGNRKTGRITTTYSHAGTCPDTCKLKRNGCYAEFSFTGIHWRKVTAGERGTDWKQFLTEISNSATVLWRHNVAGDLPHTAGKINKVKLQQLTKANGIKRGFTYTHHIPSDHNIEAIRKANDNGFTVNQSVDNAIDAAARFKKTGLPVVTILPADTDTDTHYVDGVKVVVCPAYTKQKTCVECKLCAIPYRRFIVGFPAHGSAKRKVSKLAAIPVTVERAA